MANKTITLTSFQQKRLSLWMNDAPGEIDMSMLSDGTILVKPLPTETEVIDCIVVDPSGSGEILLVTGDSIRLEAMEVKDIPKPTRSEK